MPLILNIDSATDIGSICISKGEKILSFKEGSETFSHAREITLMIESCIQEVGMSMNDLDGVAISKGPGSYTSLRIGTSTAKGICYALNKPLIGIDTLQSLALAASKKAKGEIYAPMIDARRMEVYTAFYSTEMECLKEKHASILQENIFEKELKQKKRIVFAGNGGEKIKKIKNKGQFIFTNIRCSAIHLVPLSYQNFQFSSFESGRLFCTYLFKTTKYYKS